MGLYRGTPHLCDKRRPYKIWGGTEDSNNEIKLNDIKQNGNEKI
jgi:hypothetical protein